MPEIERRYECPFGCASGFQRHELIIHLWKKHTAVAIAEELVDTLRRIEDILGDVEDVNDES